MTQLPKYFLTKPINYNRKWYNINIEYSMYRKIISLKKFRLLFIILLTLCFMQEQPNGSTKNDDKYNLLSINAVSKKLKLGYTKTKELIENGYIESVTVTGRQKVPLCKLEKFINQSTSFTDLNNDNGTLYPDDENEALKIISKLT